MGKAAKGVSGAIIKAKNQARDFSRKYSPVNQLLHEGMKSVGEAWGDISGQTKNREEMIAAGEKQTAEQQRMVDEQKAKAALDETNEAALNERNRQRARQRALAGGSSGRSGTILTGSLGTPGGLGNNSGTFGG